MKITQLPVWPHDVQHGVTSCLEIARQASPVGSGAFDTESDDTAQSGRPGMEAAIAILVRRDCHCTQSRALGVYRHGDVVGFVRINADKDLVHVCPLSK
jgi:hypothetical protein